MRTTICAAVVFVSAVSTALAQQGPPNGMRPADLRTHAITNATVIPSPGEKIEGANILIRDGVIVAVGPADEVRVPTGAWVWPADGLTVYSGLIEPAMLIAPGDRPSSAGAHWNPRITPEIRMSDQSAPGNAARRELRSLGFTTAAVYPNRGILRGAGNVIALAESDEHVLSYRDSSFMAAGFETGGRGGGGYPGSLMGAIALFRQTMLDAQWHAECRRMYQEDPNGLEPPIRADALVALGDVIAKRQRVLFDASDEQNALRAARLADEFNLDMTLLGSGYEFRRLREIAALNMPVIVPLQYPERPNVNTLAMADRTSLRDMMTWEQAPTNARRLANEGVEIALTTHRLRRKGEFYNALRSAIENGLSEEQALAALTTTPAKLLGIDGKVGTIARGKVANLVVVKGGLFERDAKIRDVWVNGRRSEISADPDITFVGKGVLRVWPSAVFESRGVRVEPLAKEFGIEFDSVRRTISIALDERRRSRARNVTVQRDHLSFIIDASSLEEGTEGLARLSGAITGGVVAGTGVMPDGSEFTFAIEPTELRQPEAATEEKPDEEAPKDEAQDDPVAGTWSITVMIEGMPEPLPVELTLKREQDGSLSGTSTAMGMSLDVSNVTFDRETGELRYEVDTPGGVVQITGIVDGDEISGTSTGAEVESTFRGTRLRQATAVAAAEEPKLAPAPEELVFPLGEYGFAEPPAQQNLLIRGATIWTSGPAGIIEKGDLLIVDGRIKYVGPTTNWAFGPGDEPRIVYATGKHITPGLLDCHSHTGIDGGVNEFSHVNTAEVRIGDVIDPDDINWYRQLAGGLTAANQLHGSANPIGGQNSIVKLKWGAAEGADAMRVKDARPGIKFALGENVVRSTSRYPNTRMGVETVMRDAFTAAREYESQRAQRPLARAPKRPADEDAPALGAMRNGNFDRHGGEPAVIEEFKNARQYPRRPDLQLDALVEILNDERDIHCHSYRQDEILMLMRVAEDLGFRVATFQHILEGYKVADVMKAHGANASAFSDWWAYKVEVMDAIPYAGAIMHDVGVNVSFNSDSSELARRMNTEASKAVRYGGISPADALKFVTINPAIQMGIDHRTGSLEVGKDADFVIWSGDPLSTYTRAEQTWIEGAMYFCLEKDRELRSWVQRERQRLIQKILAQAHGGGQRGESREAASGGAQERPRGGRRPRLMETVMDQHIRTLENMVRMGMDPDEIRPGECGCNDWWFGLR